MTNDKQAAFGELVVDLLDRLTKAEDEFPDGFTPENAAVVFDTSDGQCWRLQLSREPTPQ